MLLSFIQEALPENDTAHDVRDKHHVAHLKRREESIKRLGIRVNKREGVWMGLDRPFVSPQGAVLGAVRQPIVTSPCAAAEQTPEPLAPFGVRSFTGAGA